MSVDALARNRNRDRRARLAPASSTLSDGALAVLAAVPAWWARRAAAAGLSGACLDVKHAVAADVPVNVAGLNLSIEWICLTRYLSKLATLT